ncbi:hypothetical protein [Oceanirhabdus seepicola]|uniref:Uncharacterized protein n=1 Tax=Oceanirhabdus seepicola TaxID=2828781 RepID=A0A9J6NXW7_9CLOT|nr:hypothetical protein [Oceanirhabdus seepicola]MCM1988830.1 hypothetical protein [Oceanirhabdus seepicola]
MAKLLTLAMSEMSPKNNKYKIIAYWIEQNKIISIDIDEENFKDINKHIVWDIGAVTQAEQVIAKDNLFEINGDMILLENYNKRQLKEILDRDLIKLSVFKRNQNINYCITKVKSIYDIRNLFDERDLFRSKVTVYDGSDEEKNIKIKDYRWIKYWNYIYGKDIEKKSKEQYEELFINKEIYLIMYRFIDNKNQKNYYSRKISYRGDNYWIAGIHYF